MPQQQEISQYLICKRGNDNLFSGGPWPLSGIWSSCLQLGNFSLSGSWWWPGLLHRKKENLKDRPLLLPAGLPHPTPICWPRLGEVHPSPQDSECGARCRDMQWMVENWLNGSSCSSCSGGRSNTRHKPCAVMALVAYALKSGSGFLQLWHIFWTTHDSLRCSIPSW